MAEALRIGVVPGVSADKWVRVWRERMRHVPLDVVPVAEEDAAAALEGEADMVFARLPIADPDLHVIPLWTETPMVVAAKDHPIKVFDSVTLADLADEELYPGSDDATLDIVAAGHGIARMPQSVFRATGRRDLVAREVSDAEPTRVALVWRAGGELVDEFIGIVRGRTANSSRGAAAPPASPPAASPPGPASTPARRRATPSGRGRKGGGRGRRR
ncbi:LysR family transcriptional regulator substrate-binding protein [Naasia sp. SYSU D00948]|uniref:LysR family transcriptional regulator substrate-binding protein n=1 Tax=Naasia sp. SYSU D00948 TaxID=2817379 RepID=UPI001B30FA42|nr:LysR family transcriptional regulator substrate-binding protein [Naasia sp. SYSU D00948]